VAALQTKSSVRKYLTKLARRENGFVGIHLIGEPGIGKTHFGRELSKQISSHTGYNFPILDVAQTDQYSFWQRDQPDDFLQPLVTIGKTGKPFGILIFDEAQWLSGPECIETAKRALEMDLGSFQSRLLGNEKISFNGMFVIVMTNKAFDDEALKSRLITVNFPNLKKKSLEEVALRNMGRHLEGTDLTLDSVKKNKEVKAIIEQAVTMRDIHVKMPTAIEKILQQKDHTKKKKK
jgi:hypothetical protein